MMTRGQLLESVRIKIPFQEAIRRVGVITSESDNGGEDNYDSEFAEKRRDWQQEREQQEEAEAENFLSEKKKISNSTNEIFVAKNKIVWTKTGQLNHQTSVRKGVMQKGGPHSSAEML